MQTTEEVRRIYGLSPFAVLNEEADNVIMLLNYLVEKAENNESGATDYANHAPKASTRKNDGFWDF